MDTSYLTFFAGFIAVCVVLGGIMFGLMMGVGWLGDQHDIRKEKKRIAALPPIKYLNGLFLDDQRKPEEVDWVKYPSNIRWVIVRNREEFFKLDLENDFDVISLDHDLGFKPGTKEEEPNGYEIMKELCDLILKDRWNHWPSLVIHGLYPEGRRNMVRYWQDFIDSYNCKEFFNEPERTH